jgi:hypothetical protein
VQGVVGGVVEPVLDPVLEPVKPMVDELGATLDPVLNLVPQVQLPPVQLP